MDETGLQHANTAAEMPTADVSAELKLSRERILAQRIRERALTAWPNLSVNTEPFIARVLACLESMTDTKQVVDSLAIEDLFLAYACSMRSEAALAAFAREFDGEFRSVTNKLRVATSDYDDLRQSLWNKLFLTSETQCPKILEYLGKGPLRHWFRVLATRLVLDELRKEKRLEVSRAVVTEQALSEGVPDADPELAHIRERYRSEFHAAFGKAVSALDPEERNLLRCTYLNGMSTDELGRAFGMHKATAARHLSKARDKLLDLTRAELKEQLGANSGELDSVIRLFDGELSISLSRLLS
jgi:RNA polymerase sigma-70 factor (ECF subfamily)